MRKKILCNIPPRRSPPAEPLMSDGEGVGPKGPETYLGSTLDEKGRLIPTVEQAAELKAAGFEIQVGTGRGFFGLGKG